MRNHLNMIHDVNFNPPLILYVFQHCKGDSVPSESQGPQYENWTRGALFKHPTFLGLGIVDAWQPRHVIVNNRDWTAATVMSQAGLQSAGRGCIDFELFLRKSSVSFASNCPQKVKTNSRLSTMSQIYSNIFGRVHCCWELRYSINIVRS